MFAEVYTNVLEPNGCVTSYCHWLIGGPPAAGPEHNAYVKLVGVASTEQGCGGMTLVAPGDPDHSLLYLKLSMDQPPCGSRMPSGQNPLAAAEVDLVRAWIAGGAPE
jgi:hypothetical protein